jgi:beta-glucosidase
VAGTADDIGQASGGWTLTWQGTGNSNADFPNGQSIWSGVEEAVTAAGGTAVFSPDGTFTERPDVAVVVFGETPYAEFQGDLETLDYLPVTPLETLRRLKDAGVPTVSVFLSGRPMWTNPEINASDAFVAAWLPGTEGGGVADVIVAGPDGRARHDFSGTLSFSWPRSAEGTPLNRGEPGYDPQFAYGYGLSYARPAAVARLSEDSGVSGATGAVDRYLVDGRIVSPWSLSLRDTGGETRSSDGRTGVSPRAGVSVRPVDDLAQESGRQLAFAGGQEAVVAVNGPPVDLSRQSNGELTLSFRYRVDVAPTGRVSLAMGQGVLDIGEILRSAPAGDWRMLRIRLSCFRSVGTDVAAVDTPFVLTTDAAMTVSVSEIQLASHDNIAVCPAA